MSEYALHGFASGQKLTGADMREMDEQILTNVQDIATLTERVDDIPSDTEAKLNRLRLETDGDTLFLMYGDIQLASVALPLDLDSFVACTALDIIAQTGEVLVGDTVTIASDCTPSDCSQRVRWSLSDRSIAQITSAGVLTGLRVGRVTVSADCGRIHKELSIAVKKRVSMKNHVSMVSWLQSGSQDYVAPHAQYAIQFLQTDDDSTLIGNIPFDLGAFKVADGQKVTLRFSEAAPAGLSFRHIGLFKQVGEVKITDLLENNNRYYVENAKLEGEMLQFVAHGDTVTLTNATGADSYFAFTISGGDETMLAGIDDLLIVEIVPM